MPLRLTATPCQYEPHSGVAGAVICRFRLCDPNEITEDHQPQKLAECEQLFDQFVERIKPMGNYVVSALWVSRNLDKAPRGFKKLREERRFYKELGGL